MVNHQSLPWSATGEGATRATFGASSDGGRRRYVDVEIVTTFRAQNLSPPQRWPEINLTLAGTSGDNAASILANAKLSKVDRLSNAETRLGRERANLFLLNFRRGPNELRKDEAGE